MHLLQVGGQVQRDTLSQTKNSISELISDEVSRDVGELYLQDDWLIGAHWEILTGIRYQDDQDFGDHVAPKVAVKYNRTDARSYLSRQRRQRLPCAQLKRALLRL